MSFKEYSVEEDEYFIRFCNERNIAPSTRDKYVTHLEKYTNLHQMTLEELINEATNEEENGVRMVRRKIRQRLLDFRTWMMVEKKHVAGTIKTNMRSVLTFYKHNYIETPILPPAVLKKSLNEDLQFSDLPTMNTIKTAIESTKKQNHKVLFLFAACTGSARNELAHFTFGQFLEGVKPFCHNPKTPQDVIDELDGKCEELELIPVFKMHRFKTNYSYHTPITPECLQFCINYLKSEGLGLKPEDNFFQLGLWGISSAFQYTNYKFNWGKRGSYGFFSVHRVRKFNASAIEDVNFANYIQGRKPDPIRETYFKRDINRVREEYKKHMHKFTIYAHYNVMINSEAYQQLKEQLDEERQTHEEERERLRADYEDKINELEFQNSSLSSQVSDIETRMNSLTRANELTNMINYARADNLVNEHNLMSYVVEIYQEKIAEDENFYPSRNNMDDIIVKAYNRKMADNTRNTGILGQSTQNFDEIYDYVSSKAKEMIEQRSFILSQNIKQELESKLMNYAQEIDNEIGSNDNWEDLIDNRRISRIVAEITKSIRL